ncbi:MAG: hypothetical protein HC890_10340 [Chloroflexaceae bacterium]|nr:hypothetical protein [Chloroflexaceae bacterium]
MLDKARYSGRNLLTGDRKKLWRIEIDSAKDGVMLPRADFMDETQALRQQLQQWQLALYRAVQMSQFKAGFLARTAHELRSPLASLMGLHQLVLHDLCENREEEREFIAQAHSAAQKLMNLLDEVVRSPKPTMGCSRPSARKFSWQNSLKTWKTAPTCS